MQLSKHFTLKEMTKSMTAQRKGIDNTPGSGEIKSLGDLCYEVLEPLRAHFDKPVTITSGYVVKRCVKRSAAKRHRSMRRARRLT
jgi:hypothetical protein